MAFEFTVYGETVYRPSKTRALSSDNSSDPIIEFENGRIPILDEGIYPGDLYVRQYVLTPSWIAVVLIAIAVVVISKNWAPWRWIGRWAIAVAMLYLIGEVMWYVTDLPHRGSWWWLIASTQALSAIAISGLLFIPITIGFGMVGSRRDEAITLISFAFIALLHAATLLPSELPLYLGHLAGYGVIVGSVMIAFNGGRHLT